MPGAGSHADSRRFIRTFLDIGVLIEAYRGKSALRQHALAILRDRTRWFITTPFLKLEAMPKAEYFQNELEIAFYRAYFGRKVRLWITDVAAITELAREEARRCGLAAMDALHVAAAHLATADEFITTEKPGSPLYKTSLVQVVYLPEVARAGKVR